MIGAFGEVGAHRHAIRQKALSAHACILKSSPEALIDDLAGVPNSPPCRGNEHNPYLSNMPPKPYLSSSLYPFTHLSLLMSKNDV